jgi:hypothetical protein
MPSETIYYAGPGGAAEFMEELRAEDENENPQQSIRDLVLPPLTGSTSAIPKGLIAGVMGALASA